MSSDFRSKMMRHPLAPKTPATMAIPAQPAQQPAQQPSAFSGALMEQPGFVLPDPNKPMTLKDLADLTKDGDKVSAPRFRPMTPQEMEMVKAGQIPGLSLSELERRNLLKAGWDGSTVPPAGFPEALQEIIADYVNQKRAEGVPFESIKIRDINDLPQEEQIKVKAVFQQLVERDRNKPVEVSISELTEYPESIRNEILKIQNNELPQKDIKSVSQPTPKPVSQPVPQPVQESEQPDFPPIILPDRCPTCGCDPHGQKRKLTCIHCGCDPLEDPEEFNIDIKDKQQFLLAIGTGYPFRKEYSILHDTITVTFRSLRSIEYENLSLWSAARAGKDVLPRAESYADYMERVQYYELMGGLVLQTVFLKSNVEALRASFGSDQVQGSSLFWAAPEGRYAGLKEWKEQYGIDGLDALLEKFREEIPSESVITMLRACLIDFNRLDYRLTREGLNTENFWKGI
jgi:hypothetical protein